MIKKLKLNAPNAYCPKVTVTIVQQMKDKRNLEHM